MEELELDTNSLYLALVEKILEGCMRTEMEAEWERLQSKDCPEMFTADAVANWFRTYFDNHKKWQEGAWTFQRGIRKSGAQRGCDYIAKFTVAIMLPQTNITSVEKFWLNEQGVMDPGKNIAKSYIKFWFYVNKQRFPNKQSHCCNIRAN